MGKGNWSVVPPFSCGPAIQIHKRVGATVQGVSVHVIVLRDERAIGLWTIIHTKYVILLGSEGIWTTEYATVTGQGIHREESQGEHEQAGCMPWQW